MPEKALARHRIHVEREFTHAITRISEDEFLVVMQHLDGEEITVRRHLGIGDTLALKHKFTGEADSYAEQAPALAINGKLNSLRQISTVYTAED